MSRRRGRPPQPEQEPTILEPADPPADPPATPVAGREPETVFHAQGQRPMWLRPESPVPVFVGVFLVASGIALVGYTWLRVSGLLSVPLQLPYVASSGFTGLGFVLVGGLVVNVATKRRDAAERARRLEELSSALAEVSRALEQGRGR